MKLDTRHLNETPYHGGRRARTVGGVVHNTFGVLEGDLAVGRGKAGRRVSFHDLIAKDGTVYRLLSYSLTAWHAGVSYWRGLWGLNRYTVGWELSYLGDEKPTKEQLEALSDRVRAFRAQYGADTWIAGHRDVAWPRGRKPDPVNFEDEWLENLHLYSDWKGAGSYWIVISGYGKRVLSRLYRLARSVQTRTAKLVVVWTPELIRDRPTGRRWHGAPLFDRWIGPFEDHHSAARSLAVARWAWDHAHTSVPQARTRIVRR